MQARGDARELAIDGVPLRAIVEAVGTPAYVYSASHIAGQLQALKAAFAGRPTLICYAIKANSAQPILRLLGQLGAGADIVSGGELERALAAGIPGSRIVYSGVGKRPEELDAALGAGVRGVHVESAGELAQLAARARALGVVAPVALRLNPDIDPKTHPYLATGLRKTKFGIPMQGALELALQVARTEGLRLVGLTCHIGSQIMDAQPFLDSLARLRPVIDSLARANISLDYLDLGGGLGIPYAPGDEVVDVASFGRQLVDATADLGMELVLEPGRFLVGNGGVLVTRVIGHKRNDERAFVIVDGAMNDLVRPALYSAHHTIVPAVVPGDVPLVRADIVGPVCECGDFFARDRPIPWPAVGDVLAVLGCGAYAMTMASTYNTRPIAPEVLVSRGRFAVTRPRRAVAELIAEERYPEWLSSLA
ncbi:MAG: diaminopimelate decarboxylase [Myxococcales bacterium]|nr:diaminopimelate decarboxylase [Myxococcales bacterium]